MRLMNGIRGIRRRLSSELGIALPAVMGMMLVMATLTAAVVTTTQSDTPNARRDQDRKAAYGAAEAGLNAYLFRLSRDSEVWTQCTSISGTPFVNQPWDGTGADPRTWRALPSSAAQYTVELLPKAGQSACSTGDPAGTMIANGQLRLRATGRMRGTKRSIIAKLRRRSFLDFMYFTDIETLDPAWYTRYVNGAPTTPDITGWATANCGYYRDGRGNQTYNGVYYDALNRPQNVRQDCVEIQFAGSDVLNGPMHTNDEILVCGRPRFGRTPDDALEVSASPRSGGFNGWRASCSGASPDFRGSWSPSSPILTMPPANDQLRDQTDSAYIYTGRTEIVMNSSNMSVKTGGAATFTTVPYPSNGLIYVQNGACGQSYRPYDPYNSPAGCADVYVKGTYPVSLTIASQKDIIINGDVTKGADTLLGLIANDFVRIYHPIRNVSGNDCDNAAGAIGSVQVDAAIMALNHSFMVDHYYCGGPQGTLQVNGTIIQKYRGPVGQGGSTIQDGYIKAYAYDDRLRVRQPPQFLDPVQSSWRLLSSNEMVPAR